MNVVGDSFTSSSLSLSLRHDLDAANRDPYFEQRRPPLVPDCPKLGPSPLAGAALLSSIPEDLTHHASTHHHAPALSPAGPCPPGLQNQGQVTS